MDLQKVINRKDDAAQYMIDEITHICKDMDTRSPGTKGEEQACQYMADVMKDLGCESAELESFKEHPASFFGWIYFTITLVLIGIILFFTVSPLFSIITIALGLFIAFMQFGLYKKLMDPFFPELTGTNVTAIKKPAGEVKRRIFFNGHPDAAWEWPVNYKLGGVGFEGHAIICGVGAVYFLVISIIYLVKNGIHIGMIDSGTITNLGLWGLLFVPFLVGLYWMWNENRIVDGANDNLSGCYMGIAILKMLKEEGVELENTEIGICLTGSEEAGLRGSMAWSEAHKNDYNDVPTIIISYDTIHDPKYLMTNYRDLNGTVKVDKEVSDLFMESAKEVDVPILKGWVPPLGGATDSAAFAKAGFRATGITGLNHKLEDYYHTRRDTYDNMNAEGLANCFAASVKALEKFDNGVLDK